MCGVLPTPENGTYQQFGAGCNENKVMMRCIFVSKLYTERKLVSRVVDCLGGLSDVALSLRCVLSNDPYLFTRLPQEKISNRESLVN